MPLTFGEAYAKVCPTGGEVRPNSKEYKQIMELMKQSGHVPLHDRMVRDSVPKRPTTVQEAMPYLERIPATEPSGKISKRRWLSIDVHREAFIKHLNKK
jgi:hypothetical protein